MRMGSRFSLRELRPEDGPGVGRLMEESPDTGRVGTAMHFEIDPIESFRVTQGDFIGVVAEVPGSDGLAGCCLARFGRCQFEGDIVPHALVNTLVVHPDHRRRGIATALVNWLLERCRARLGKNGLIWELIQQGNVGSVRTANKYMTQFFADRITVVPMKPRARPPRPVAGITVQEAKRDEFEKVADRLNAFYREFNLYEPQTADSLATWCETTPFDDPFRHYLVAVDDDGDFVAGIGVSEGYRMRTLMITHMPAVLRALNAVLKIVPPDGITRGLELSKLWFAPGRLVAARYLVEEVRFRWRDKANMIIAWVDEHSPVFKAIRPRPWTPITRSALVILESPVPASAARPVYYE